MARDLPAASSMARRNAIVEPLPLVPATWITGGSRSCGRPSALQQPLDPAERQVDAARMERAQRLQHARRVPACRRQPAPQRATTISGSAARCRNRRIGCAVGLARSARAPRPAVPAARCGSFIRSRQSRATRRAELVAVHDHVDHAVLEQIFGALEALRQLLADRLLDDARAGEADQRARLGDVDVAEHGVGGGDAAGRRIGEDDDVGKAGLLHHLHGDRGARQLHQREDALLHARAAGRRRRARRADAARPRPRRRR